MCIALIVGVGAAAIGCSSTLKPDSSVDDTLADAFSVDAVTGNETSINDGSASDAQADGWCADPQHDPQNCGRCGHSCLGGGCNKGKCQPVFLASQPNTYKSAIRIDQNFVYYAANSQYTASSQVFRMDKNGGSNASIANPNANDGYFTLISDFQVTTTDLYITVGGYTTYSLDGGSTFTHGRLVRCPLGGCGVNHVDATSYYEGTRPFALAVDPAGIFFSDLSHALWRCDSPSCGTGAQNQNVNAAIYTVASDGTDLYFTDYSKKAVMRCALNGCGNAPTYVGPVDGVHGLAVHATDVFAASVLDDQIVRIAKSGGAAPFATGQTKPSKVIVDANYVVWTTLGTVNIANHSTDGTLARCPVAGCGGGNVDLEVLADSQDAPEYLAQDDVAVYWVANSGGGTAVWKIAKP